MIKALINSLKEYKLDVSGQKVVLGVSTGIDSMTLLYSLEQANLGCEIIVCHVNHGKRQESLHEEKFIRQYCQDHHLKLHVLNLSDVNFDGANFQEEARNLRYDFFFKVMEEEKSHLLLLAHHLNDDMETMLMRLIRGSNLKGYAGIEQYQIYDNKIIFRPFLNILKDDIIKFAQVNNLKFFDDYTNFTDLYTRNRIRQHIIPELFKENENVHLKFLEFKDSLVKASQYINEKRDQLIKSIACEIEGGIHFKKNEFIAIDSFMQVEILFALLKNYQLSKKNIEELIKYIYSNRQNLNLTYKNFTFVKEYNDIYLYFTSKKQIDINIEITDLGIYNLSEKYYLEVSKKNNKTLPNLNKVWYNSNMFPIIIRSRRDGDKINFDYGTKKVKKILIDKKVGILKRGEVLVLEKDKTILAIFGYAKSSLLPNINDCDIVIELKEKDNES